MINQSQIQKQQMKISPQQIHLLNLYALSTLELEQRLKNELEENPFLEASEEDGDELAEQKANDTQDYQDWDEYAYSDDMENDKLAFQSYLNTEEVPSKPLVYFTDFKEDAKQQLRLLEVDEYMSEIAAYIIDMLNDRGMLDRSMDELVEDISFKKQCLVELEDVEAALAIVQTLEPIGIGVSTIRDCLLMQLKAMDKEDSRTARLAQLLVEQHYDELINRQFEKIYHALRINGDQLRKVLAFIGKLKFYPVRETTATYEPRQTIIPDFVINRVGDTIQVNLYKSKKDSFFINQSLYEQSASACGTKDKTSQQYIKNKLQSAQWFIDAVKQREETMLKIMKCIVQIQHDYFMDGDIMLIKPMVLRHISDITGLDLATISRITGNKHADTHFGPVCLKNLFSEGIADQTGKVISSKVIQNIIEETIVQEDKCKPYTDQQLVNILMDRGYKIARRTVTKYREHMKIPIAQVRAVLV